MMQGPKSVYPFLAPPMANMAKKLPTILENDDWCQLSLKKNWEVFTKIEGVRTLSVSILTPASALVRVKELLAFA